MFGFINGKEYQMKIDIQRFNQIMTELNQKIKSSYEELRKILKK